MRIFIGCFESVIILGMARWFLVRESADRNWSNRRLVLLICATVMVVFGVLFILGVVGNLLRLTVGYR